MINPEIRKFLQNTAQLCLETALKVVFVNFFVCKFESEHKMVYFVTRMYVFADFGRFKSANHKKSEIRKVSHLQEVQKSNKLFKSANLRICDLRNFNST